ncbi:2-acylglycerol O-acyltransferase 2-A [Agrilus planipennis]|uniref:Acyltransferase n=1 Tax=Agrilus planipennis TaxID=224129 RepID=A0A1W4WEM4_AGRPL|nr:2-acylglycerol O-acyltransferase 2-A [Agrilus planipennis]XP_018318569.1 2-acylglycerol O-acyltransferase 2-A [Agrilus planipennis]
MELFGIQFAPFNIPFRRRLQTLAAAAWFVTMAFGGFIGLFLALYLILFTRLWFLTILYLFWIYIDKDVCEYGGRRIQWVRDWAWWQYLKEYFPLTLERVPWVELDPKRNYLFCSFPHGMLCTGAFSAFSTTAGGFHEIFPHHTPYPIALSQHFYMPFFRELALSLGGCASSAKSIESIICKPGGGNVAVLVVGGVSESFNCKPGQYKIVLKNRKGFVKLALKHGTPLVPVMSFGETDLFSQVDSPEGSFLRKVQEGLRRLIGIAPIIPIGRGFFQYNFGLVPKRKPVHVVVGRPVDVEHIKNPTREDVDRKHAEFMKALIDFFEEEKHRYIKNAEDVHLHID